MIEVINMKFDEGPCWKVDRSTILGNRFIIGKHGNREQVIEMYDEWIHLMY